MTEEEPQQPAEPIESPAVPADDEPGEGVPFWLEDQVEMLIGSPPDTRAARRWGGMLGPLVAMAAGLWYVVTGVARVYGRYHYHRPPLVVSGPGARALGVGLLALGLIMHFHFFWPYRNKYVAAFGKVISFLVAASCFGIFFWKLATLK